MPDEQQGGSNNLILWVIAGGAIILGLVYAISQQGSGQKTLVVTGGGQAAGDIASQNEAYNQGVFNVKLGLAQDAVQLEQTRLGYKSAIQTNAQNNQAAYAMTQLETAAQEQENKDTLAAQTSQLTIQTQGATTIAQIEAQNALAINKQNVDLAHAISDNQTTQARINHKSWFDSLMGNASGILSSLGSLGLKL